MCKSFCLLIYIKSLLQNIVFFIFLLETFGAYVFLLYLCTRFYEIGDLLITYRVIRKEFFEKIYINREVVQEASVWFYIKWMGKRNEPINSLSLLLRHCLKNTEQKKRCFLLDTFRISVLKQRLLGEVLEVVCYSLSPNIHHLSPTDILQWRV